MALFNSNYSYLAYLPFISLIRTYVLYSPYTDIILLRGHLCAKFENNWTIMYADIAFQRIGGYNKCRHECSLGVYLVIATVCM